ncbi:hypothetical protein TRM7557_03852 [Tritonibacter multivorans]|uniref:Gamma-glutamyl kinase n=2 Tax=Tritonibacter multivorans TaxID=928856 RepID=A0A0N7M151_9RHOB|nr:hypothetical protein TRM7557_03852 [Tritonibacter multivorans]SFC97698.1 hypothetical protein SAMN04488049_105198 [Tritonibacter multivorans]
MSQEQKYYRILYAMMVFYKARLALLSVPKTGTTALQAALRPHADMVITDPPELKHAPVYRYNRWIRPMFDKVCGTELEVAAVMREPVDWLGSWYRFRQRPHLDGKPASTKDITFDDFVRDYCRGNRPPYANVGSQAKFLEAQPNGCKVDHLFRYEALSQFHSFLEDRLGLTIETEQKNVSPKMELTLSEKTEAILRRKCAEEFDLYDSIP